MEDVEVDIADSKIPNDIDITKATIRAMNKSCAMSGIFCYDV